jgi:serine/threonine-protein kinase RsbW
VSAEELRLTVLSRAENVAVVRHAVAGLAEALDMHRAGIDDLKIIVTEACMNVVAHAYEDEVGPLEVEAARQGDALVVTVGDHGGGFRPRADSDRESLRLGLPLIAALASTFEISGGPGQGTRVTMEMALAESGEETPALQAMPDASEATEIKMPTGELVAPVLSRVISVLAARADLSVDRLSDAVLLGDALSAGADDGFPNGTARLGVTGEDGEVVVRVGPLGDGGAERLRERLQLPELNGTIESLADEVGVESNGGGEHLVIRIGRSASA